MLTGNELSILSHLRKNARSSISMISSETSIPSATVLSRLRMLEKKGIITKYTTLIDFHLLGYHMRVNLIIRAERKSELQKYLLMHKNVNSLCRLRDNAFYVDTVFQDMAGLYNFIESLERFGPQSIEEHHIIEDIKQEELLMKDDELIIYPEHMRNA